MRRTLLLIAVMLLHAFPHMAETIKPDFRLERVTVYLVGAELNYKAKITVPKGKSTIILPNVSQAIKENSTRVKIEGVKIISASLESIKVNYEKEIKTKQDSLDLMEDQLDRLNLEKKSYAMERKILADNIDRLGARENVSSEELLNATKMYRTKLNELDDIDFRLARKEKNLLTVTGRLEREKEKLLSDQSISEANSKVKHLMIEVESKTEINTQVDVNYIVTEAGWSPRYNIRAENEAAEVGLEYRANVFNNSGINWKNVSVILSTANTETKLTKPELGYAWSLNFRSDLSSNNKATGEGQLSNKQLKNDKVEYVNIEAPELDIYMKLDVNYDIPSDGLPHLVSVGDFSLPVRYKYYAVPKVDDNIYQIAYIKGWEKLNLIEGESSIYLNGAFLGNSYLDTRFSNMELEISLGVEKGIQISRVKKEDKEAEKTIGTNRFVTLEYNIDVRNIKSKDVEVEITDQVPISEDSDIEVTTEETSGATVDEQNGKLTWNLTLKPGEFKKLIIKFSVKYPRNKSKAINFTLFRFGRSKVMCPKFR